MPDYYREGLHDKDTPLDLDDRPATVSLDGNRAAHIPTPLLLRLLLLHAATAVTAWCSNSAGER
jgi:hypothetical protein